MSWLSGFCATREPASGGLGAHLGLRRGRPEREHRVRELLGGEHARARSDWSFAQARAAVQLAVAVGVGEDRGVVAGRDGVEAERERLLEQGGELDALVAAHARVRGAAGGVLGDEVVDHVGLEALAEVPDVERDAEQVRRAAGVHRVLDGAAAAGAGAQRARLRLEREVHARRTSCPASTARAAATAHVDATAHRCQNTHVNPGYQRDRVISCCTTSTAP